MMTIDAIRRQSNSRKEAQAAQQQPPAWERSLPSTTRKTAAPSDGPIRNMQPAAQSPERVQAALHEQVRQRPRMSLAAAIGVMPQKKAQEQGQGQGSGGQGQLSKPSDPSYYNPVPVGEIAPPKKAQKRGMSM